MDCSPARRAEATLAYDMIAAQRSYHLPLFEGLLSGPNSPRPPPPTPPAAALGGARGRGVDVRASRAQGCPLTISSSHGSRSPSVEAARAPALAPPPARSASTPASRRDHCGALERLHKWQRRCVEEVPRKWPPHYPPPPPPFLCVLPPRPHRAPPPPLLSRSEFLECWDYAQEIHSRASLGAVDGKRISEVVFDDWAGYFTSASLPLLLSTLDRLTADVSRLLPLRRSAYALETFHGIIEGYESAFGRPGSSRAPALLAQPGTFYTHPARPSPPPPTPQTC
jgi:hypothetical protein